MNDEPFLDPGLGHDRDGDRLRRGGCTCGRVRYEVRGEPQKVGICHCTKCRKETGSVIMVYADWPRSAFTVTGEVREYGGRSFCPACGSRLFHLSDDEVEILLGSLDEAPVDLKPTREGWIFRREHWQAPVAGAGQFEGDPT